MLDHVDAFQRGKAELGIDRVILNVNFGASQAETLESIQCFAEDVMPYFNRRICSPQAMEA